MCLPTVKAKSIATCRPHDEGGAFVFKRSQAAQKKKVKEPFFLHAEGEESVHTLAALDNSSTTCHRVPKSMRKTCVCADTRVATIQTNSVCAVGSEEFKLCHAQTHTHTHLNTL